LTLANSLHGNPEATQTGSGMVFFNALVFVSQLTIQRSQLLTIDRAQRTFKGLAEKGDAIVRTPGNRQEAALVTKIWTGAVEIRGRLIFTLKQISEQIGKVI
jgi:hypothetical protein